LTNTVRPLTAAGKQVTIIDSIPEIGFDPPSMLARKKLFGFAGEDAPARAGRLHTVFSSPPAGRDKPEIPIDVLPTPSSAPRRS
jgi:hypothetical protein